MLNKTKNIKKLLMKVKETIKEKPITSKKLSTKVKPNIKEKPITSKKLLSTKVKANIGAVGNFP